MEDIEAGLQELWKTKTRKTVFSSAQRHFFSKELRNQGKAAVMGYIRGKMADVRTYIQTFVKNMLQIWDI